MASSAHAQLEFIVDGYEEKYMNHNEGPGAEIEMFDQDDIVSQYIYEVPTVKALAHMYWALGLYKISENNNVDEFMRINECEIYKKFSGDELEWNEIRDAAKVFIEENKSEFPTRFSFIMPLQLEDFSIRRQAFALKEDYKIVALRRFELFASDASAKPCVLEHGIAYGYPRVLNMEFSRPFSLTHIPMTEEVANEYIKKTTKQYHDRYDEANRKKEKMYRYRKAYLVMKIKIFAHGEFAGINRNGYPILQVMGILENYSIYEDKELTKLFYKQSYVSKKKKGKLNIRLKEQYEILREKAKDGGILN